MNSLAKPGHAETVSAEDEQRSCAPMDMSLPLELAARRAGIQFEEVARAVSRGFIRTQVHSSGHRVAAPRVVIEGVNRMRASGGR